MVVIFVTYLVSRFQTFGKQTQTVSISPEDPHGVTFTTTEDKQVAGERIVIKNMLDQFAQTIEGLTHIGDPGNQPDTSA
ncbi:hypothetical protein ABW07_22020 [Pluralibacter gergoviae]|nr:hypothetical protein SK56_04430 [Enterobacter sp. MGH128]KMK03859.1 hypothetical protein ABW07_22020 [Pluralibacter gergoviae]